MFLRLSENPMEDKKTFHFRRKTIFTGILNHFWQILFRKSGFKMNSC